MRSRRNPGIRVRHSQSERTVHVQRVACLIAALLASWCGEVTAEFHVWRDAAGHKHVSTVPARGYRAERLLRPGYDPNSIVYQHRRLRERLRLLDAALEEQAMLAQREAGTAQAAHATPLRAGPREGVMNLDQLIELEKRGGRWVDEASRDDGAARTK